MRHHQRDVDRTLREHLAMAEKTDKLADVAAALTATERKNLSTFGYGVKSFGLSMVEAAVTISAPKSTIRAAAEELRRSPEMAEMSRPIKKPVTLRLDADVIAWFKAQGRGYQTRINRILRRVMVEGKKGMKEK